jgi:tetratricopeptide (TPR) repeat protein
MMKMKNSLTLTYLLLLLTMAFQAAADEPSSETDAQDAGPDTNRDIDEITSDLLTAEFNHYKMLMASGSYDEADSVAKRVIELAIRLKGPRSGETAKALTNLAIVQHPTKQYDAAQQNFQSAVEIIEDVEDRLNVQLVNPLRGLATAQLEGGRPDLASKTFNRAIHVTHVNDGPHNLGQLGILESLAEVNVRLGLFDEARDIQETIFALNSRHHEGDALGLIPSMVRRAQWQHRVGFIYDEQSTYRDIIRIIEARVGKNALQLVEPLIMLGRSYFYIDKTGQQPARAITTTGGEMHFKRAVRIANENPDATWETVTAASLALGDHFMQMGSPQRANQIYQKSWNLLSEDEARLETRRKELERNVLLRTQRLPDYIENAQSETVANGEDPVLRGKVSLLYNVSIRGRASDVRLLEAEPPEFLDMQKLVQRELRRRIYRPRYFEANPVASPDQIIEHTFYYHQSDLDALRDQSSDPVNEGS